MKQCKKCQKLLDESKYATTRRTLANGTEKIYTDSTCMVCRRNDHLKKEGKREIHRKGSSNWYKNNPDKAKEQRLRKYGLTLEEYNNLRQQQNYCCAVCGKHESSVLMGRSIKPETALNVDHCHTTNKVRALLCLNCNTLLGKAKDDPEILLKAIAYLEKHK